MINPIVVTVTACINPDANCNLAQASGFASVDSTNDQSITQSNDCTLSACLNGVQRVTTFNDNQVVASDLASVTSDNTQSH